MDGAAALAAAQAARQSKVAGLAKNAEAQGDRAEQLSSAEAAEAFASVLLGTLVQEMWKTISIDGEGGPLGQGPGADVYQGLAQSALGDVLARQGLGALTASIQESLDRTRARFESPEAPQPEEER